MTSKYLVSYFYITVSGVNGFGSATIDKYLGYDKTMDFVIANMQKELDIKIKDFCAISIQKLPDIEE